MNPLRRRIILNALKLFDLAVMALVFYLAAWVSFHRAEGIAFEEFLDMRIRIQNFGLFLSFAAAWHIIFALFALYESRRLWNQRQEVLNVIKATTLGSIILLLMAIIFQIQLITIEFLATFWIGTTIVTVSSRLILRFVLKHLRLRGRNLRFLLIVGTNPRAITFAKKIEAKPELGYRLLGFVDNEWPGMEDFRKTGYEVVSGFDKFPEYLRSHVVDEVMVFLPVRSQYQRAAKIVSQCEIQGILCGYLQEIFKTKLTRFRSEYFEDDYVISYYSGSMQGRQVLFKRMADIFISLILICLFTPFFFVIAVLIKMASAGPVFFIQERLGLNKRRFRLYKFRTMVPDAEKKMWELEHRNEVSGPVFKIKNDPRITRVGKLLRKTSIDEFPQFFNVLKGDMSLVGPRPLPVRDYEGFDRDWQRRRFSVRPGMTCLWQVNGRSKISFEKWMQLDMEYIDNWSLGLDFKVLLRTIPAVLRGSGAS